MTENILAVLGFTASMITTVILYIHNKEKAHEQRERVSTKGKISFSVGPVEKTQFYGGGEGEPIVTTGLVRRMEEQILARIQSSPQISREEIQKEVEVQINEVQERIQKIENRFPKEAALNKTASINDVLLSERLDQLSKQVENLQNKMLSRWDVALVVSAIITAAMAVIGATYGVLKIIGTIPG